MQAHATKVMVWVSLVAFTLVSTCANVSGRAGSLIHITGYMMMRAMDEDRILAWHDNALGDMFFEDDCESDEGLKSLECMTEKLTHCPRSSMREDNSVEYGVFSGFPTGSFVHSFSARCGKAHRALSATGRSRYQQRRHACSMQPRISNGPSTRKSTGGALSLLPTFFE